MADTKTVAQLLAEAATYTDKVDVLVALAIETAGDKAATAVAKQRDLQKAVGESTDDAVLDARLADAKQQADSLQLLRDERDKSQKAAAKTADPSESRSESQKAPARP